MTFDFLGGLDTGMKPVISGQYDIAQYGWYHLNFFEVVVPLRCLFNIDGRRGAAFIGFVFEGT